MKHLDRALLGLLTVGVSAFGAHSLGSVISAGATPGLSSWGAPTPLLAAVTLPALAAIAVLRRHGWSGVLGAALAWALGARAVVELPARATNFDYADGPHLRLLTFGVALAVGLFAAGARAPGTVRAAVVCLAAATANGRLFARTSDAIYGLLAVGVLWLAVEAARAPRRGFTGAGRWWLAVMGSFVLWVVAAGLASEAPSQALDVALRVLTGALLAGALALGLESPGRRALVNALLLLGAASLAIAAAALTDAAAIEGWSRVLGTRLRLFGLHPNGCGPYFGALVALGIGVVGARTGPVRLLALAVTLASGAGLWATDSRASLLGTLVACAVVSILPFVPLPRRAWPSFALVATPAIGILLAWIGPFGERLREGLAARALGPSAIGQRYHFWRMALDGVERSPWVGVGANRYDALARYAQPSYYDGTPQTLHSHNLELSVAVAGGWPALLLFLLVLVALLEAARHALRTADGRRGRFEVAGVLGFALAILVANQLDLGQAQQTLVPLALWIALGWLVSCAPSQDRAPWGLPRVAAWLLLPCLVGPSLLGSSLRDRAAARYELGDAEGALAAYRSAIRVAPAQTVALTRAATIAIAL
ncbi:MAG: O-antigen ligase family protein, partial [Planctomycetota bacterium]